jgi:DNA polymerase-1
MQNLQLPNIRKLFLADFGYIIADTDLDRADLQVVVWEADDADLKRQLRLGVDLHIMNGIQIEGKEPPPEDELIETHSNYPEHKKRFAKARVFAKAFIHGTNYGGKARTMARTAGIQVKEAERLQKRWFSIHPGIEAWHRRVEESLLRTRSVTNAFGFRRLFFERVDAIFPQALAWVPQSTVANVTNQGIINLYENLPQVQVLLQVHDSIVWQVRATQFKSLLPEIKKNLEILIPYPDPLLIPVGLKASPSSWGECRECSWTGEWK